MTALDEAGNPEWGIEVRTARIGNQRLAYLINFRRNTIQVDLRWKPKNPRFADLDSEQAISSKLTLKSREIIIGSF
ncbi:MAG: hypothetical protein V3W41_09860 [Planctomycetota bacterium]